MKNVLYLIYYRNIKLLFKFEYVIFGILHSKESDVKGDMAQMCNKTVKLWIADWNCEYFTMLVHMFVHVNSGCSEWKMPAVLKIIVCQSSMC